MPQLQVCGWPAGRGHRCVLLVPLRAAVGTSEGRGLPSCRSERPKSNHQHALLFCMYGSDHVSESPSVHAPLELEWRSWGPDLTVSTTRDALTAVALMTGCHPSQFRARHVYVPNKAGGAFAKHMLVTKAVVNERVHLVIDFGIVEPPEGASAPNSDHEQPRTVIKDLRHKLEEHLANGQPIPHDLPSFTVC